jgi:hypothetical protein
MSVHFLVVKKPKLLKRLEVRVSFNPTARG